MSGLRIIQSLYSAKSMVLLLILVSWMASWHDVVASSAASSKNRARQRNKPQGECFPASANRTSYQCYKPPRQWRRQAGRTDQPSPRQLVVVVECVDEHPECGAWSTSGECDKNPGYMKVHCRQACGTCIDGHMGLTQVVPAQQQHGEGKEEDAVVAVEAVVERWFQTQQYWWEQHSRGRDDPHPALMRPDGCSNQDEMCTYWAALGHCDSNPGWMLAHCGPACWTCH